MKRSYLWGIVSLIVLVSVLSGCFLFTGSKYSVSGYVKDSSGNGISGVTISFSGGSLSPVTTDSNGYWSQGGLSGSVIVTPSLSGYTFTPTDITVTGANDNVNFTGSKSNGIITYGNFGITTNTYVESSDWDQIVQENFGSGYRVADWNDLVQYYNTNGETGLIQLLNGLNISNYGDAAWLKYNGQSNQTGDRYYYLQRNNHNTPSNFAVFADIDNHLVDLGTWWGSRRILAIKKSGI